MSKIVLTKEIIACMTYALYIAPFVPEDEDKIREVRDFLVKAEDNEEEMVIISKDRYNSLVESENFLEHLEASGVDNWEGYGYACDIYRETWED